MRLFILCVLFIFSINFSCSSQSSNSLAYQVEFTKSDVADTSAVAESLLVQNREQTGTAMFIPSQPHSFEADNNSNYRDINSKPYPPDSFFFSFFLFSIILIGLLFAKLRVQRN